jgi:hypothetical protein
LIADQRLKPRSHEGEGAHVGGLLLNPDELPDARVGAQHFHEFLVRERKELFQSDLSRAEENTLNSLHRRVAKNRPEAIGSQLFERREGNLRPEQALWCQHHQRFAPSPQCLPAQKVKVLPGRGRLANLDVVFGSKLEESLHPRTRVFRTLSLVAVREEQNQSGQEAPLVLPGRDKLVQNNLGAVGKIAELSLPADERLGVIAAVTVLEADRRGLGQRRVVNRETGLSVLESIERDVFFSGLHVEENRVAVVERTATAVLTDQPHRCPLPKERPDGQRLGGAPVNGTFPGSHLPTEREPLRHLVVQMEVIRGDRDSGGDLDQPVPRHSRVHLEGTPIPSADERAPVFRERAEMPSFSRISPSRRSSSSWSMIFSP